MSKIIVNNLSPDTGISTITVAGNVEATKFVGIVEGSTGTFSSNVTIDGNLGVAGTITYEDVARVDATGLSTFREGFGVGPLAGIALTAYKDGSIRTSGIVTASSFVGSGANLTGITQTTINTNADNRIITGSGTANTLNGESNLTYDGSQITSTVSANDKGLKIVSTGNHGHLIEFQSNIYPTNYKEEICYCNL